MNTMTMFSGLRVYESDMAVTITLRRTHKRRRSQSAAYHARIQKKWKKRYGEKRVPAIFKTDMGLVVHPQLMSKLRAAGAAPAHPGEGEEIHE